MYHTNELEIRQHHDALIHEAEQERLARIALEDQHHQKGSGRVPGWMLAALGHRWSVWGNDPHDRFGEVEPMSRGMLWQK